MAKIVKRMEKVTDPQYIQALKLQLKEAEASAFTKKESIKHLETEQVILDRQIGNKVKSQEKEAMQVADKKTQIQMDLQAQIENA